MFCLAQSRCQSVLGQQGWEGCESALAAGWAPSWGPGTTLGHLHTGAAVKGHRGSSSSSSGCSRNGSIWRKDPFTHHFLPIDDCALHTVHIVIRMWIWVFPNLSWPEVGWWKIFLSPVGLSLCGLQQWRGCMRIGYFQLVLHGGCSGWSVKQSSFLCDIILPFSRVSGTTQSQILQWCIGNAVRLD